MKPYYEESGVTLYHGDCRSVLSQLPDESVNCCVTSPPYWGLRDYGVAEQIGMEKTPDEFVSEMVQVFREVRRVLTKDGTLWLNLGDSYNNRPGQRQQGKERNDVAGWKQQTNAGCLTIGSRSVDNLKPKDLIGIPWRVAFALQSDGWWLRSDIIWAKPAPMPESVTDRPTRSHEYIFLLSKSETYYYDHEAIKEPSVSDHGSGNGFKRPERLSFADDDGARGNEKPWQPKSWNGSKFDGQRDLLIHPNVGRKPRTAKNAEMEPQHSGRRMVENVARARAAGGAHDMPFGDTRNKRDVWTVNGEPFPEAHFATFPPALILPCVLAGSPEGGVILDPFSGAATTAMVSKENGRLAIGIELNPDYLEISRRRLSQEVLAF